MCVPFHRRPFGTESEFFIQLFVEFDEALKNPTVENLLQKMFREQQISFASVRCALSLPHPISPCFLPPSSFPPSFLLPQAPSKLLVQVPRFGKHFKTYKRIIPGIKLDPSSLMESPSRTDTHAHTRTHTHTHTHIPTLQTLENLTLGTLSYILNTTIVFYS